MVENQSSPLVSAHLKIETVTVARNISCDGALELPEHIQCASESGLPLGFNFSAVAGFGGAVFFKDEGDTSGGSESLMFFDPGVTPGVVLAPGTGIEMSSTRAKLSEHSRN